MSLDVDMIFADPVLQRVYFDGRVMAPDWGREAELAISEMKISELKTALQRAQDFDQADRLRRQIRTWYFAARRCSIGYLADDAGLARDGCQHIVEFAPFTTARFEPDRSKLAHLRHRFANRGFSARGRRHRAARSSAVSNPTD